MDRAGKYLHLVEYSKKKHIGRRDPTRATTANVMR
jgi:hypothetical protein